MKMGSTDMAETPHNRDRSVINYCVLMDHVLQELSFQKDNSFFIKKVNKNRNKIYTVVIQWYNLGQV